MPAFMAQVRLAQLEMEFRAQIEVVLTAGLQPTHLDWHCLRVGDRADIFEVMLRLAREYGLALRVVGRSWIEKLQGRGFPTNDYDFLDRYSLDLVFPFDQVLRTKATGYLVPWAGPSAEESQIKKAAAPRKNGIVDRSTSTVTFQPSWRYIL